MIDSPPFGERSSARRGTPIGVLGWVALGVGCIAFLLGLVPFLGVALGVAAVVLGIVALVRKRPAWVGIVAIVAGSLALLAGLISSIGLIALLNSPTSARPVPVVSTTAEGPAADAAEALPSPVSPSPQAAVTATPEPPAAPDLSSFGTVDERTLALIAKEPDNNVGQNLIVFGSISQLDSATGPCNALISIANDQKENSYDYEQNSFATSGDAASTCPVFDPLVQGDHVKLWVTVLGSFSYDTQIGGNTTVPAFQVWQAELLPAQEY